MRNSSEQRKHSEGDDFYVAAAYAGSPSIGVLAGTGKSATEDLVFEIGPQVSKRAAQFLAGGVRSNRDNANMFELEEAVASFLSSFEIPA